MTEETQTQVQVQEAADNSGQEQQSNDAITQSGEEQAQVSKSDGESQVGSNDGSQEDNKDQPTSFWPDDWRARIAGEDKKMQKYLDRFNSPEDIAKSGLDIREKISTGEYKRSTEAPLDDEKALAEWRSENGVPESPDKYTMPEGVVVGEADKESINSFLENMHKNNVPDNFTQPAIDWYFKFQEQQETAKAEQIKNDEAYTEEALRQEWGMEYKANRNEVENFVKSKFGDEMSDALMSNPETVKTLASIAREINPVASMFPNSNNPGQTLETRMAEIEGIMNTDKYKKDPKIQDEYKKLLETKMRQK